MLELCAESAFKDGSSQNLIEHAQSVPSVARIRLGEGGEERVRGMVERLRDSTERQLELGIVPRFDRGFGYFDLRENSDG